MHVVSSALALAPTDIGSTVAAQLRHSHSLFPTIEQQLPSSGHVCVPSKFYVRSLRILRTGSNQSLTVTRVAILVTVFATHKLEPLTSNSANLVPKLVGLFTQGK